ncbi:MAG: HXXEE domain-containing protein [Pseudomonadota bacterium]
MTIRLAALCLAAFFALTWLPLGQQAFMEQHWMKIGAFVAPILMFMAVKHRDPTRATPLADISLMASVFAAAYLLHQVEEHWVDLLGRPYPLYDLLNSLIAGAVGEDKYGVMTPSALFYVNAGTVWTIAFVAILVSPRHVFPAIAMAGLMFVNGVAHAVVAAAQFSYNPGLATSIVLFVPLSVLFFRSLLQTGTATLQMILAAIFYGVFGHIYLFAGLFAANIYGLIPPAVYYVGLILFGLVPLALFRPYAAGVNQSGVA